MLKPHGLYGHIRRNIFISRALIASFLVATCFSWIFANVAYNLTFRARMGEVYHRELMGEMFGGGAFKRKLEVLEGKRPASDIPTPEDLTLPDLALLGVSNALWTLYVPAAFVTAWLALFFGANQQVMSWAMGARPLSRRDEPTLYNIVENLSIQTGTRMPNVEIIESSALNAYAYGLNPEDATIGVTRGLLSALSQSELEAVIAHEYTHILNQDTMVMAVATVFVGIFDYMMRYFWSGITGAHEKDLTSSQRTMRFLSIAWVMVPLFGSLALSFALVLVPSTLARAWLSRSREFLADAGAVELTKDADALVRALVKVAGNDTVFQISSTMQAMLISSRTGQYLATHPPIEDRVAALRAFAGALVAAVPRVKVPVCRPNPNAPRASFGQRTQKVGAKS